MTTLTFTQFPSVTPHTKTEITESWPEFVARLRAIPTYRTKRACPLISLCAYGDEVTTKGSIRHADNVLAAHGIEIDYDAELMSPEEAAEALQMAGVLAVVVTSASHKPKAPRWRAYLPLSAPVAPEQRRELAGRANRILGGVASRESFTLSQSYYVGRVASVEYQVLEAEGRPIDRVGDIEPLYPAGKTTPAGERDATTDADLRGAFERGEDRYTAMLKLSSRWAARGMAADDIAANLEALIDGAGKGAENADGIDLRARVAGIADSAVDKFGDTRAAGAVATEADFSDLTATDVTGGDAPTAKSTSRIFRWQTGAEIIAERREAEWLIDDTLEARVLALLAGPRGSFKSFIVLDWAMRCALAGKGVAILSGEGAGLDRRMDAFFKHHAPGTEVSALRIVAFERAVNLNVKDTLKDLVVAIRGLAWAVDLVVVDTFSKYAAGLDENDNSEVAAFLSGLAAVRDAMKATFLLVAHTGHSDQNRPRGASSLMANPDAEYVVARTNPTGPLVSVTRARFKDTPALPPLGYEAVTVDLGRNDKRGRPVTSLALRSSEVPTTPNRGREPTGTNQRIVLTAFSECALSADGTASVEAVVALAASRIAKADGRDQRRGHARQALNALQAAGHLMVENDTVRALQ